MLKFLDKIYEEIPLDDSADKDEQLLLYSLVRSLRPKTVVETGTHRGVTTLILAHAMLDAKIEGHVHTADPYSWEQQNNFDKFPELSKYITYHSIFGRDVPVEEIDFLFIDGFHEKQEVLMEWGALSPKLSESAVVVFHDCGYPGNEACDPNGAVEQIGVPTVWIPTKNRMRIYGQAHRFGELVGA